jgi:hypothetical protein
MIHAGRDDTVAKGIKLYDRMNEIAKMSPYEKFISNIYANELILELPRYRYLLIWSLRLFAVI